MKNFLQKSVWMMALCFIATSVYAQVSPKKFKKAKGIEVTYQSSYKGKVRPGEMIMKVSGDQVSLESAMPKIDRKPVEDGRPVYKMPKTKSFMDYSANEYYRWAELPSGEIISSASTYEMGKDLKVVGQEKYLGLNCTVVRTSVRSNTIEIWYTNDIAFRGTPQPNVGVPDGLVLRVVRNGDTAQEAVAITPVKEEQSLLPETWGKKMIAEVYQYQINHSNVITVPVFNEENVGFTGAKIPETLEDNVSYNVAGGTILLKKVKLPEYVKDRSIFVELIQWSDGDAYDRTGSVFVIPTDKKQSFLDMLRDLKSVPAFKSGNEDFHGLISTDDYNVPLELMRFFTGFGVRQYNHNIVPGQEWSDSVLYKTEVTALADRLQGEVWVGAYIGNWDAKGHKVTLKLKYYPDD
ncbi:MAG: glpgli family protein, partial [Bacteroidaceae bacterium]|nr:glpgli family protein [Bacteroidaceae bacterium]